MSSTAQRLTIFVAVLGAIGVGQTMVSRAGVNSVRSSDFPVFLSAAHEAIRGGQNLYTITDQRGLHYIYPPTFAVLMAPLAVLPPDLAAAIWYLLNLGLLAVTLYLAVRLFTPDGAVTEWSVLLFPVVLTAEPMLGTLTRGQLGILMLACCVIALYFHGRGRPFLAGLLIAFATTLKIYSGLILFYFLIRRDWRALAGSVAGAIVFGFCVPAAALGTRLTLNLWRVWITTIVLPFLSPKSEITPLFGEFHNLDFVKNQSLLGTMKHLGTIAGVPESGLIWIKLFAAFFAAAILVLLPLAWKKDVENGNSYRVPMQWSLAMIAGLMLIPVAWIHYYCLLILPFAMVSSYLRFGIQGPALRILRIYAVIVGMLCAASVLLAAIDGPLRHSSWYPAVVALRSIGFSFWTALITGAVFFYLLVWHIKMPVRG